MDIVSLHSVYCIGIKGAGVSALAQLFHARGVRVSGSDTAERYFTQDALQNVGILYVEGFAAANIPAQVDLVVRSTAYGVHHVEVAEALQRGFPVMTYPEAAAAIFNAGKGIAVCGTHGKTTTTAMLGWILAEAGKDPTVIVGGVVPQFGGSMRAGKSDLVVLEADEYEDKLAQYQPHGVILTNIEWDHPDFFPTPEAYRDAFARFVAKIPAGGFLIACADDPVVVEVARAARCAVVWYGPPPLQEGELEGVENEKITLHIPGRHNVLNARAALAAAERLGVTREDALHALASFRGTKRRFEIVGEIGGVTVIDDYAHHPGEIRATIAAAQERYPQQRILVAFQPHTFTRTIALQDDFARAFAGVARVFVMNIFGSAREKHGGISSGDLAAAIVINGTEARASGGVAATVGALADVVQPGNVVLCCGAGENDKVARGLVERLRAR